MTLTQRRSSLYKAKLERQIEELRDNGENASDAANHFKNFHTFDSAFGDDFTVLPKFVLTETLEHLNNSGKNTRKSADAIAELASAQNALICARPPSVCESKFRG